MSTPVTIQVKLESRQAEVAVAELNKKVSAAFTAMRESVGKLNAQMKALAFDPAGILRGTDQATRGIESVQTATRGAALGIEKLSGEAAQSGEALGVLGKEAAGAGGKLTRLAGTSTATGTAFADMATGAEAADVALLSLDEGASAAGKSVAGMGRAAASALPKLDALSTAAFDPAGVVAGADESVLALDRVKMAAVNAKTALRGGAFFGGGGRRSGRGLAEAEEAGGWRAGAGAAVDVAGGGAALVTLLAAVTGKLSAGFDNLLQGIRGNTTMSDADAAGMRTQTLGLMKTGTSETQLAEGYKHIANFGYHGQAAAQIADYGNKFGIGTHTNVEETDDMLAGMMNANRHADASQVSRYANMAHFAAAGSNMDVRDLEKNSTRTVGLAANYMGPGGLADALAAYSALVQHRVNPARADTQVSGMIGQIAAPTPKAQKEAAKLGLSNFNAEGLAAPDGLFNIIGEVRSKIAALPKNDQATALKNLFNNKQGGIGASFLTGAAHESYDQALNNKKTGTKAAFAGKANAIDPAYNAQMKQTQQQFAALGGEIKSDFIPIGERLGPVFAAAIPLIRSLASGIRFLLDGFTRLPKPIQEAVLGLGALKLISSFLPMLGGFALVSERTTAVLGGLGKMLLEVGNPFRVLGGLLGGAGRAIGLLASGFLRLGPIAGIVRLVFSPFALILARLAPLFGPVEVALAGVGGVLARFAPLLGPILPILGAALPVALLAVAAGAVAFGIAYAANMDGVRAKTAEVGAKVVGFINSQFGYVKKWFTANMPLIRETVKTVLNAIQEFWKAHGTRIMAILNPLWSLIKTVFSAALHIIGAIVKLAMDVINGHWSAAAKDVGVIVTNLWAVVRSLFENGGKAIGNALMLVIDTVLDFGKRLFEGMLNAGQQAVNGLVGGIKSKIGQVKDAVTGLANMVTGGVASALDIHSPSRVMHKLGLNTAEGMAQGIRDGRVNVEDASRMLANTPAAIVRNAIADARRGQAARKKRDGQVHAAGEFAATVGETPEQKQLHKLNEDRAKGLISAQQYTDAHRRIVSAGNKSAETEARRHAEALAQIHDGLQAFKRSPETPSLDKQEITAHAEYRRQIKDLGGDTYGPHPKAIESGMRDASVLLGDKLSAIQSQRDAKQQAADTAAAEEADAAQKQAHQTTVQLNRELWQHAGGDMKAYFQSLRDEAKDTLKGVQDKFGPASAHPNAPAVTAATAQNAAQLLLITQQQTDAENSLADARQQHDLDQGRVSLAHYVDYLTKRRDAYAQYSQEWLDLDSRIYSADEEMQRKQLQSIEDLFQAHKISLDNYKKMLSDLAAQVPVASSVHQDVVSAANSAQNKANRGELVGGEDFWDGLAGSAAESGSKVLTALLHPKDKKSIFKSMWDDLLGSMESGVTGGLSKIIKNMLTGQGGGTGGIGGFLGGLFGGGKQSAGGSSKEQSGVNNGMGGGMLNAGMNAGMGTALSAAGLGPMAAMLPALMGGGGIGSLQGINGAIGGAGTGSAGGGSPLGVLGMLGGKGGLAGLLGHGGLASIAHLLPWLGGGLLLNNVLGNPFGKALKGLKKIFHFSGGGVVPGIGNHDTVDAKVSPEEMVLPKHVSKFIMRQAALPQVSSSIQPGASASGGRPQGGTVTGDTDASITIHQTGDHHYHTPMDVKNGNRDLARMLERARRGGVPTTV